MKYLRIKISYVLAEERFYRTFLVNPNTKLRDFGCAILTTMFSTFENDYYFGVGVVRYLPRNLIRKYYENEDKFIGDYAVKDLPDDFIFYYGMDEYTFNSAVQSIEEVDGEEDIYLVDGKGQGVWENTAHTLNSYLLDRLDPTGLEEDYFEEIFIPKNVQLSKYGDFDTAFNLELMQELFQDIYQLKVLILDNYY